jgi:hypothetical protein
MCASSALELTSSLESLIRGASGLELPARGCCGIIEAPASEDRATRGRRRYMVLRSLGAAQQFLLSVEEERSL